MAKTIRRARRSMAEINVVPYIDVMLVLLVIFMITAPLLTQGVKVSMPEADAKAIAPQSGLPIIVTVDQRGRYYLNVMRDPAVPVSSVRLARRVAAEVALAKQRGQSRAVLVRGDLKVGYGKVVQAMVLLQQAGVSEVGLMTESPTEKV